MTDVSNPPNRPEPLFRNAIVADALLNPEERTRAGLPPGDDDDLPVVVELNLQHVGGLTKVREEFLSLWHSVIGPNQPELISETYFRADLNIGQIQALVRADTDANGRPQRTIYRIWPDFPIQPLIDASTTTVKADAARRAYDAAGRGMTWAVIDSGIDSQHPHFTSFNTLVDASVAELHRDFTLPPGADGEPVVGGALTDNFGHGTHVAGIIAGGLIAERATTPPPQQFVVERVQDPNNPKATMPVARDVEAALLSGIAPYVKLVSLKVLDDDGRGRSMNVVRALEYVRRSLNGEKLMRVQGVNLSVGYEFDAKWFACGQSPLCVEVDRLVRSGVVVVVAAGNTGYGTLSSLQRQTNVGFTMTINDPGNAGLAITVGATHRDMPHTYGVSYFSSKGPTGDGRLKPDLVAPGERITSAAAGRNLSDVNGVQGQAWYVDDSGTSMAAPHVSGVIAAFLSIRREFVGKPEEVKRIFVDAATSLGRERYFQGGGLVDLMRAIQSI